MKTDGPISAPVSPESSHTYTEVIVVGGGPAGLAAAIEMGQRGIACVIIEPRATIDTTRPRAKTTSTRTMEHLRRWGIAERLRDAAPLPVSWSQDVIFADSLLGSEITRFPGAFGLLDRHRGLSPENGQQAPQPVVEAVLRSAVEELADVHLMTGFRVVAIMQDESGVEATVESVSETDGRTRRHTISGHYLLGCDGSSGPTRRAMGISYLGSSNDIPNLSILFRAPGLADRVHLDPAVQYWIINRGAAGLMGRLDLNETWWAIVQSVSGDTETQDPASLVHALLGTERGTEGTFDQTIPIEIDIIATDPWNARMLLVERYRDRRVFLVGDAAHLNPPWGGHGFNTCVADAVNIGWKLAAVLRGWAGPGLLDSYQAERRPVAAQTIADAGKQEKLLAPSFVREAESGPDAGISTPADMSTNNRHQLASALQEKQGEFSSAGLVLGYHYADSPAIVDDGSPVPDHDPITYHRSARPGARLPHAWIAHERSIFDMLGPGFAILHRTGTQVSAFVDYAASRGIPLISVAITDELADAYGANLLLIRPDQHVSWRGQHDTNAPEVLRVATGQPLSSQSVARSSQAVQAL